ncbi:hypothetical protein L198_02317 [Cryptococcus wingfieldii CBS 7118]|uniref:Citrate transporter-like domain-containing protein n=1 Tax=Cryptococcus wingfieldii CBS 7118 TaxID=1295528 RepID=A0A1E3JRH6_9TREE|nr:hypothetical protein L198_02317 [Cryptococcus wingfieldii CBS 7118]ODO03470.1 hypothetical protein L198_02317 [Cryptococcus wingfieldii CBS 7118]
MVTITPLVDGQDRSIDARSIVTLIFFFAINALVIWPVRIPVPLFVSRLFGRFVKRSHKDKAEEKCDPKRDMSTPAPATERGQENTTPEASATINSQHSPAESRVPSKRVYIPIDLRTAPVIGVLILLAFSIPGSVVRRGIVGSGGVRPYDIMTLFICFAYISISLDTTGFLRYLAFLVASRASRGQRLFTTFYFLFAGIGLVFGNDPLVLSGTPFLAYFTDHAAISDPTPFIFSHFQVSNLVSAFLVSSNPTNLVLTSAFAINFLVYSAWMAIPTIASAIVLYFVSRYITFSRKGLIPTTIHPPAINPRDALLDPVGAVFGATVFVITVLLLVGLSAGGILEGKVGVWTVTVPAAGLVFLRDLAKDLSERREKPKGNSKPLDPAQSTLPTEEIAAASTAAPSHPPFLGLSRVSSVVSKLPLALLPFAFSFFILVEGLQHTGWISVFGGWWGAWEEVGGIAGSVWLMGMLSVIGCNVFGTNIGATILLARVIQSWSLTHSAVSERSIYAAILTLAVGSNFGAYSIVFSASLAGLLWRGILRQKGIHVTVTQFMRWNTLAVLITMAVGCLIVAIETRFPQRQMAPYLEQRIPVSQASRYYSPDSPLSRSRSRGRSPGRGEEGMRMSGADTPYTLDQDDGDSQANPILEPYHNLERWTYNDNHTWPHRPKDEERAEQVDWIKLQSDSDCIRSMMVIKEEPVDGSEIDQDRRTAFQKLGLTVRREEPISYNLIQEITLPVPCPPEAEGGDDERTSVSKIFIWDHLEGEHNPYGCGGSICEGYPYDTHIVSGFEERSEGACKPYHEFTPELIEDVFDMLCRRDTFAEVDTGLPPDAPLKEVSIKVATFNAKSDLSTGIGVVEEEKMTRIHHEICGTEFCAGSRTEEEARNELVEPEYLGDKCRPDVWYIFEPEDGVAHRHSRLVLYDEAFQLDAEPGEPVHLEQPEQVEEPEEPEPEAPEEPEEFEEEE